jgi:pyridoxal 5'-phosphate synthase pdxS subunit
VTDTGTMRVKSGLAEMLKGGVIMDVTNAEQARIAEDAGACAVMALERVPSDIRRDGGVARMADPSKIREIQEVVDIPVMAKATSPRPRCWRRSTWTTSTSPRC